MKRLSSVLIALVAVLAIGSVAVAAAEPGLSKDVATKVTIKFQDPGDDPYGQNEFTGKVKAKKGCDAGRKVVIKGAGDAKSSKSGKYSLTTSSAVSGKYTAVVKAATVKDGKKTIDCAAGKSKTITVP